MKLPKLATTIIFVLCCVIPCFAQYEEFYKVGNNTYVTTAPNAELYELSYTAIYDLVNGKPSYLPKVRDVIDVSSFKIKRIKKPQQLKVLKYTNTSKQQGFNAYIVDYKDKYYVLYNCDVQDNTAMNDRSAKMLRTLQNLETQKQQLAQQLDSLVAIYTKESTDSLEYYKKLKTQLPQIRDSVVNVVKAKYQYQRDSIFNNWLKNQTASVRRAASVIRIDETRLGYPNSVGGCDYHLYFTNLSSKTIKYLRWSGQVYNRVNDPAYCEIRRTASCSGYYTGPIAPENKGWGCWDCVVYNYAADTVKLNSITIDYTDGSHFSLSASDIRALATSPIFNYMKNLKEEEQRVIGVTKESIMTIKGCEEAISLWEGRLNLLNNNVFSYRRNDSYKDVFGNLKSIELEINKHLKQLERFEKFIKFESY